MSDPEMAVATTCAGPDISRTNRAWALVTGVATAVCGLFIAMSPAMSWDVTRYYPVQSGSGFSLDLDFVEGHFLMMGLDMDGYYYLFGGLGVPVLTGVALAFLGVATAVRQAVSALAVRALWVALLSLVAAVLAAAIVGGWGIRVWIGASVVAALLMACRASTDQRAGRRSTLRACGVGLGITATCAVRRGLDHSIGGRVSVPCAAATDRNSGLVRSPRSRHGSRVDHPRSAACVQEPNRVCRSCVGARGLDVQCSALACLVDAQSDTEPSLRPVDDRHLTCGHADHVSGPSAVR